MPHGLTGPAAPRGEAPEMLWTRPATTTSPAGPTLTALVDLGCRLYQPTLLRIAGLDRRTGPHTLARLDQLLPEGSTIDVITRDGVALHDTTVCHLHVDGVNILDHLGRPGTPPRPDYGHLETGTWTWPARIRRVVDADTIDATLDVGTGLQHQARLRIAHVDAPEQHTPAGDTATGWAREHLAECADVTAVTSKPDKYGRMLATLTLTDGSDYSQRLVAAGHARPYDGGPR